MDFLWSDALNLFDIIHRSQAHQPLTPSERTWLKAYKGIVQTVIAAAALFLYQFLTAHASLSGVNWQLELTGAGVLLWKTYMDARSKFFTSQAPAEAQTANLMTSVARGFATTPGEGA